MCRSFTDFISNFAGVKQLKVLKFQRFKQQARSKSYIQEYLEKQGREDIIKNYELKSVSPNTLCIERTFIDKVFSVMENGVVIDTEEGATQGALCRAPHKVDHLVRY